MKALDFWNAPNTGATNASFFTAFGAGTGYNSAGLGGPDACIQLNEVSYMWTSSMTAGPNKPAFALYHSTATAALINLAAEPFPFGSVRCMKDCDQQPSASVAGPDQVVTGGNYTALAANTPEYGLGIWKIISDHMSEKQGIMEDKWDPNSGFYGYPGEVYTLEWQISNECTLTSDACDITFSAIECGSDFVDQRNGKIYPTVQVGNYCWMARNMDIGEQTEMGTNINDGIIQKTCYNDDQANCEIYGGLYMWSEAVQHNYSGNYRRGICPLGWFIPTDAAWCDLTSSLDASVNCGATDWLGTNAGGQLKESGTGHWLGPNTGANNSSGFTALGAGYAVTYPTAGFNDMNVSARFWTSTHASSQSRYYWYLGYNEARVGRYPLSSYYNENSVRCVHYPDFK
nr:hypothetical protein [Bacteroidota bacterium]